MVQDDSADNDDKETEIFKKLQIFQDDVWIATAVLDIDSRYMFLKSVCDYMYIH